MKTREGGKVKAPASPSLTRLLGQLHGLPLLEGRHLVEAQVFPGVLEPVEVDALAVDHHVRQLLGQFQLLLLLCRNH